MYEDNVTVEKNTGSNLELYIDLSCPVETTPLYQRQVELEKEMRRLAVDKFLASQKKLVTTHSASDSAVYAEIRKKEIRNIVRDMESNHKLLRAEVGDIDSSASPALLAVVDRMTNAIGYEAMAVIGFNETVNSLSFGRKSDPFEDTLIQSIAEALDYQAFMSYIENIDQQLLEVISRYCLSDQQKKRNKRIQASIEYADRFEHIDWDWLEPKDKVRIGNWVKDRVFYGTGLFESMPSFSAKESTTRYVIMLTEHGESRIGAIEDEACNKVGNSFPMVHPPRPWKRSEVGGYLTVQPGNRSHMIHNHAGTIVSDLAIDALNNTQRIGWQVNKFIYDVQVSLLGTTQEIGAFRSYDDETYKLKNPLIEHPAIANMTWDEAKEDPEKLKKKKKAYAIRKQWEQEERTTAQKTIATKMAIEMAARFIDEPVIYVPWFFDNRLRQYCLVDTLNPQGSDNIKALIKFADGVPKSDASYRDILISLATTYGGGLDKLPFEGRIEAAQRMVPIFKKVATEPTSKLAMDFWTKADEPFQFLALVHEYYHVFIKCDQILHHVSSGRDATCSGIQIAGALLRDAKTCKLVNVTPSDTVQDAYRAVAEEAVKLLEDPDWLREKIEKRETARAKKAEKQRRINIERQKEGLPILREVKYEPRDKVVIPLEYMDRSVAKMIVMLTPYGGSFQTMLGHVEDKLKKKGCNIHPADVSVVTHALVEGMANALPGFADLNKWFQQLAGAVLAKGEKQIKWVTPTQSVVKQEYFDTDDVEIKTFNYGETKVPRYLMTREKTTAKIKDRKMRTALAANTVHSLDAALLQLAVADYTETPFTTVHDCVYGPSGSLDRLVDRIKESFYQVVSGDFLYEMLQANDLEEDDALLAQLRTMTHEDNGLLESIKHSQYLFS
jgi:DNA-directed RNA polymerase, mitochondrial